MVSAWVNILPAASGICNTVKYSGLMKLSRACCSSGVLFPRISNRVSQPFEGGVALVEIPAPMR